MLWHLFSVISLSQVACQDLTVTAYPEALEGLVNEELNITVNVVQADTEDEVAVEEIFWEATISYITPAHSKDSRACAGNTPNIYDLCFQNILHLKKNLFL